MCRLNQPEVGFKKEQDPGQGSQGKGADAGGGLQVRLAKGTVHFLLRFSYSAPGAARLNLFRSLYGVGYKFDPGLD